MSKTKYLDSRFGFHEMSNGDVTIHVGFPVEDLVAVGADVLGETPCYIHRGGQGRVHALLTTRPGRRRGTLFL